MNEPTPFASALRDQLVAAAAREAAAREGTARRRARRPGPLISGAVAVVIALVTIAALVLPGSEHAEAGVVVRVHGNQVEVTLVAIEHAPHRIEEAVREAGLDVSIQGVHVGPSRVGRFVGQESSGPMPAELRPLEVGPGGFLGFVLPVGWTGSLHLLIGIPTPENEVYGVFSDALAPGEPLACRALVGRPAGEVGAILAQEDLLVRGEAHREGSVTALGATDLTEASWRSWVVAAIDAVSAHTVVVRLDTRVDPDRPTDPACRR